MRLLNLKHNNLVTSLYNITILSEAPSPRTPRTDAVTPGFEDVWPVARKCPHNSRETVTGQMTTTNNNNNNSNDNNDNSNSNSNSNSTSTSIVIVIVIVLQHRRGRWRRRGTTPTGTIPTGKGPSI